MIKIIKLKLKKMKRKNKISPLISHDNLEIRLDINAPQIRQVPNDENNINKIIQKIDVDKNNPHRCQSFRASHFRELDADIDKLALDSFLSGRQRPDRALSIKDKEKEVKLVN